MKEDVSVRVCGVQRCPGAEEDVSELVCEGVFKHTADGWLLAYEEPSEAGTVKTLLRFVPRRPQGGSTRALRKVFFRRAGRRKNDLRSFRGCGREDNKVSA